MRGHDRCRSHRDAELGPRDAGAPPGNLNALRQGHRAQPLSPPDLQRLTAQLVEEPDHLPLHLDLALRDLHGRTGDPFNTLIALRALLPLVAGRLFTAELKTLLGSLLPPPSSPLPGHPRSQRLLPQPGKRAHPPPNRRQTSR